MIEKSALKSLVRLSEELDLYYMEFGMTENRPWGYFVNLEEKETHKLKRIVVNPGGKLSYQMHHYRDEVWTIIKGGGIFILDDIVQRVGPGTVCRIPAGRKHRIMNDGDTELEFIEVQTGTYFGEDDIVRYSDDYGRV
jgi:mannose-6-phosphate isomerase-like protein (cupin superfamily)